MLQYSTIYPKTLQLLKKIQETAFFNDYRLVGGTALALQLGHRVSIDLDLFLLSDEDVSPLLDYVDQFGDFNLIHQTKRVLHLVIDSIKVDFVHYQYDYLEPPILEDGLKLASIKDIAAMKLAAIAGRGSRKDFIDLYFILKYHPLEEVIKFYNDKFPDGSEFLVLKSLSYFNDAELEPMPKMIHPIEWEIIKRDVLSVVKKHFP